MCVIKRADLNSSQCFGGALADMEEPRAGRFALSTLAGRSTQVDHQRLVFKQAHQMCRFFTLSDADL